MEPLTMQPDQDIHDTMLRIGQHAKLAAAALANASTQQKNQALTEAAAAIRNNKERLLAANAKDLEQAKANGVVGSFLDRLELNDSRIESMAAGLEAIAELEDPVGHIIDERDRPNGLKIGRVRVPLGVIGIIYESRPNVTADAGGLCIKSGNAAILRGGSESFYSSSMIAECLHEGLKAAGLPEDIVQLIPTTDREAVGLMLTMPEFIDIIVPRGGKGLCKRVQEESRVPTLLHLDGNCHTYIHAAANPDMAVEVVQNAKLRRTGICGATESLVVDEAVVDTILPKIVDSLTAEGCEVVGDERAKQADNRVGTATDEDWDTEYLDAIISVKVVPNEHEAIDFINAHSSHHTDAIITDDPEAAATFLQQVDSAIVMHNTSTQFADGGEFGMGAEIGISTGRLHARGPVGVEQLTTYKYVVKGNGQVRPKG